MSKTMEAESHLRLRIRRQEELLGCVLLKALRGPENQHKEWKKRFIVLCCLFIPTSVPKYLSFPLVSSPFIDQPRHVTVLSQL